MGISINIAQQLARVAPLVKDCKKGVMLHRQEMHFRRPRWTPRLINALAEMGIEATPEDIFQEDGYCETYLKTIGWPKLKSVDFSDVDGAEYVFDLGGTLPRNMRRKFDLVYDGGTTEHIFDIARTFRNIDMMLQDGGIFISNIGTDGWFGHGFYQIGPDVPWRFWVHSMGYKMLGCWTYSRKGRDLPRPIPDPTFTPRGAEHRYDVPQFLFYVVQKQKREGDPAPVVQSHYVTDAG